MSKSRDFESNKNNYNPSSKTIYYSLILLLLLTSWSIIQKVRYFNSTKNKKPYIPDHIFFIFLKK